MIDGPVLVFGPESERMARLALAGRAIEWVPVPPPKVLPPPDALSWHRAISELALFNWLLLPTEAAATAVVDSLGGPPAGTLRIAATGRASEVLRAVGREPEIASHALRATLNAMASHLGRRQRVFVAHGAEAGVRVGHWLEELGAEAACHIAYALDETSLSRFRLPTGTALIATAGEAESLVAHVRTGRLPATAEPIALTEAARDAALDLGIEELRIAIDRPLDPFEGAISDMPSTARE